MKYSETLPENLYDENKAVGLYLAGECQLLRVANTRRRLTGSIRPISSREIRTDRMIEMKMPLDVP